MRGAGRQARDRRSGRGRGSSPSSMRAQCAYRRSGRRRRRAARRRVVRTRARSRRGSAARRPPPISATRHTQTAAPRTMRSRSPPVSRIEDAFDETRVAPPLLGPAAGTARRRVAIVGRGEARSPWRRGTSRTAFASVGGLSAIERPRAGPADLEEKSVAKCALRARIRGQTAEALLGSDRGHGEQS
jgi:hypothetical protein